MATPNYVLLACDVFREELRELGGEKPPWCRLEFLDMGLHDNPSVLREAVQRAVARLEAEEEKAEVLVLAYGRCGNGLVGVRAGRCPLVIPKAHDCISVLLGGTDRHDAVLRENPGIYFYSPGWVRGRRVPGPDREARLKDHYEKRYPDDPEVVAELVEADAEMFLHHDEAGYVSIIDRPEAEAYCRACAGHLGWRQRSLAGDAAWLAGLLAGEWDEGRFLIVPPGGQIVAGEGGGLRAEGGHG